MNQPSQLLRFALLLTVIAACDSPQPELRDVRVSHDVDGLFDDVQFDPDTGAESDPEGDVAGDAVDAQLDAPDSEPADIQDDAVEVPSPFENPHPHLPTFGVFVEDGQLTARVRSRHASRVELWTYSAPTNVGETSRVVLAQAGSDWTGEVPWGGELYYGLRAWGPNWPYDEGWAPGSEAGFVADVDGSGNRFNPNKLLVDPYALELSHDPATADWGELGGYRSGPDDRLTDSAPFAPKGVVFALQATQRVEAPARQLREDVIYEVHLRGLTANDESISEELRGTYAGAALKAPYLAELGVTAVEFLPLHETQNDRNDVEQGTAGDNYWGYASLSFFAPERRYSSDRSPGGPTRELIAMVDAFHEHGIKVFVDVVYNHTGEGGAWGEDHEFASVLSLRGLDNAEWYHTVDGAAYRNDNGVGPNLNYESPLVRELILDSVAYYHEVIGVDGFRFDLAAVLGNSCFGDCFEFESGGFLSELARRFARTETGGVDLIAEPWGTTAGTYQIGAFPVGWHEWNDRFRVAIRAALNEPWTQPTPGDLAMRLLGSSDLFRVGGRGPDTGIGYVVSHDGFTWGDLFRCEDRNNGQAWPWGPSDGGSTQNQGADYGGDETTQRQAARTAFALMAVSPSVPMLTGGDEFLRTQRCNNNAYNLDSVGNWLDWQAADEQAAFTSFVRRMLRFRRSESVLSSGEWTEGVDRDDDGLADITWYTANADPPSSAFWTDSSERVLAWRLDADERQAGSRSIYVAWNRSEQLVQLRLPVTAPDTAWYRVADTAAWLEFDDNSYELGEEPRMPGEFYDIHAGSALVLVER